MESPPEEVQSAWEEARRVRDQVSTLMGQYLLRGYRMLNSFCPDCDTVLMKVPAGGREFCIRCTDIQPTGKSAANKAEVSVPKDADPKTAADVPNEPVESQHQQQTPPAPPSPHTPPPPPPSSSSPHTPPPPPSLSQAPSHYQALQSKVAAARELLVQRLEWATRELQGCSSVELSTSMCQLIKSCADALRSLNDLQQSISE